MREKISGSQIHLLPKEADTWEETGLRTDDLSLLLLLSCPFSPQNGKGWNFQHMLVQQLLFCKKVISIKIFSPTFLLFLCMQLTVEVEREHRCIYRETPLWAMSFTNSKTCCKKKALRISLICENVGTQEWFFLYSHGSSWYFPIICFIGNIHNHLKQESK